MLVGDKIDHLIASTELEFASISFFNEVMLILERDCFDQQPAELILTVKESLPIFAAKFKKTVLSLKFAETNARDLGIYDLKKSKKENEPRTMLQAAMTLILYIGIRRGIYRYPNVTFYSDFNSFRDSYVASVVGLNEVDIDDFERKKLVHIANLMKVILLLVPNPKGKRAQLIDVVVRLAEGKNKKYITGSGQSPDTCRRCQIYQKESGVDPKKRPRPLPYVEIAEAILNESISSDEILQQVCSTLLNDSGEANFVSNFSFTHPTEPSVQIQAHELVSDNGSNLLRSVSMTRELEDGAKFDISRSVSLCTFMPPEVEPSMLSNDFLLSYEEVLSQELEEGVKRSNEVINDGSSVYREVSLSKIFSDDTLTIPDYAFLFLNVDSSKLKFVTADGKIRSISQILDFGLTTSTLLSDSVDDIMKTEAVLPLKGGAESNVLIQTISFNAVQPSEELLGFKTITSLMSANPPVPSFISENQMLVGDATNSTEAAVFSPRSDRVRPRLDDSADDENLKIPRSAWDGALDDFDKSWV